MRRRSDQYRYKRRRPNSNRNTNRGQDMSNWVDDFKRMKEIPMVPPAETDADADRRINGYLLATGQKTLDDLFPGVEQARIIPEDTTYGDSEAV